MCHTEWDEGNEVKSDSFTKTGADRRYGVEFEVSDANGYADLEGKTVFGCKGDGSVSGDGCEFVSPILEGDAGLEAIDNFLNFAESRKWGADESCGFHLHIDVTDLTAVQKKRIAIAYRLTQDMWLAMVPRRRRTGGYSTKMRLSAEEMENESWYDISGNASRYEWCNITGRHGTIEIRLHHGTLDRKEIKNWIVAHLRFVAAVVEMSDSEAWVAFNDKGISAQFRVLEGLVQSRDVSEHFRRVSKKWGIPVV
jgi:hypothetical protein